MARIAWEVDRLGSRVARTFVEVAAVNGTGRAAAAAEASALLGLRAVVAKWAQSDHQHWSQYYSTRVRDRWRRP